MNIETVNDMLNTRLESAKKSGNTTEVSLLWELLKMSEELQELKKRLRDVTKLRSDTK